MSPRAFLIAGPTASGKTALALEIAERVGGAVINADSMQVYRDFRILTARPTPEEEARAPHFLFGHVDAAVNYSVGSWLVDFAATLAELDACGLTPVVVGGTGMYFKAAFMGLSDIPAVPDTVRQAVRAAAQGKTPQQLHAELAACDPQTAQRLRPSDPQRILRALEVFAATGKPLSTYHRSRCAPLLKMDLCRAIFLSPERSTLYARIDRRYDQMIDAGALDEVAMLRARGLDPALPAMRAHGAPHLMSFLNGELSREEATARGKSDTRHYARRQFTFARHQLPGFEWLSPDAALARLFLMPHVENLKQGQ
jgi:tRNA dimethylallyltransferase